MTREQLKHKLGGMYPHEILKAMSRQYSVFMRHARSDAEYEFWMKCTRATQNLSSGTEKWLEEMIDEEENK